MWPHGWEDRDGNRFRVADGTLCGFERFSEAGIWVPSATMGALPHTYLPR